MADQTEIQIRDNGPIKITGPLVLKDGQGNAYGLTGQETVVLCRCGHSQNKPFCDGSHRVQGFESVVQAK